MTDQEYLDRAESALAAIERGCDRINEDTDADIDNQRTGGLITLTFVNRSQVVVNLQPPLHEIWLAARTGGYHYRHDGTQWRDTKTGEELFTVLSREVSLQAGQALQFSSQPD